MPTLDISLHQVRAEIAKSGRYIHAVNDGGTNPLFVPYSHTCGLADAGHPEVIIYGLPEEASRPLLHGIAYRLLSGESYEHGAVIHGALIGDLPLTVVAVVDTVDMGLARQVNPLFRAIQLVWPDAAGRFPRTPGYAVNTLWQPLRGMPAFPSA